MLEQASGLVDAIRELADDVDIVRIVPAVIDVDLRELQYVVLPRAFAGGSRPAPLAGATLRDTLHLERPANRFATR